MKITVFTSNQARHVALVESLASIADRVYAVQECNTIFPGEVEDFYKKTEVMQRYFAHVLNAEREVFGVPRFSATNVQTLAVKLGDLNRMDLGLLEPALQSDLYVVFGSSFIKGELCEFLVRQRTLNIHMGVSPYYRGNSCNFWAIQDGHPDLVGATIHLLTKGLDSGPMLFHTLPAPGAVDPFRLGMNAVRAAHEGLVQAIRSEEILSMQPVQQDKSLERKYTRNRDFTDAVAAAYLENPPAKQQIAAALETRDLSLFLRPYVATAS